MNNFLKRCMSIVLLLCVILTPMSTASAATKPQKQYVTIDVERFTIGQGYFIEPVKIPYEQGDTAAKITIRLFERYGVQFKGSGTDGSSNFYLAAIKGADTGKVDIPEYITKNGGPSNQNNKGNKDDYLGEMDYSSMAGWMITVNHTMINVGAGAYKVKPGDVIRWQFTVWGYGADLGLDTGWGDPKYYTEANKTALLSNIAEINLNYRRLQKDARYKEAYTIASRYSSSQAQVDAANQKLVEAINKKRSSTFETFTINDEDYFEDLTLKAY